MLPKDEENHAVVCLGVIEDDDGVEDDDLDEEDSIGFSPVYLFIWRTKFSVCVRTRQLLCETYQGKKGRYNGSHNRPKPCQRWFWGLTN